MARKPRVESPGVFYHVMNRGWSSGEAMVPKLEEMLQS
jgi:hypothetical protein